MAGFYFFVGLARLHIYQFKPGQTDVAYNAARSRLLLTVCGPCQVLIETSKTEQFHRVPGKSLLCRLRPSSCPCPFISIRNFFPSCYLFFWQIYVLFLLRFQLEKADKACSACFFFFG